MSPLPQQELLPTVPGPTCDVLELNRRRERGWIARSPRGFEIYRYREGAELLRDPRFTKAESWLHRLDLLGVTEGPVREAWEQNLTTIEGADRLRLRRSLSALLAPKQMRAIEGQIRGTVEDILDDVSHLDTVDLLDSVLWRLPALTYCALVAAPESESRNVARFSDSILGPLFNEDRSRRQEHIDAHLEATEWVRAQIEAKRPHLGDDFTSMMIRQQIDGVITEEELVQEVMILLTGSVDNTLHQGGIILGTLLEEPDRWRQLVEDPELIPSAIEEAIRIRPRFGTIFRQATADLDLDGVEIKQGGFVFVSVRAAHRDPREFERPDEFVIGRTAKQPLMFGNGLYRCLGQHLARIEFAELLRAMTQRFPDAALAAPWQMSDADAVSETRDLRVHLRATLV
jgi:cytochrome P450